MKGPPNGISSRSYGTLGCLVLIAVPGLLLDAWLNNALTWKVGLLWSGLGASVLLLPLIFTGSGRNDS